MNSPSTLNLPRRFASLALVSIVLIAGTVAVLLDWFVEERLLWQQANLTREFVQSLMLVEKPLVAYFNDPSGGVRADVEKSLEHIAVMPDMLRANVYGRDRSVIWSSNPAMIGQRFGVNPELEDALQGQVRTHHEDEPVQEHGKTEYTPMPGYTEDSFIEIYVPVLAPTTGQVLGVIEFYKHPGSLLRAKHELRLYILVGALLAGGLLFITLFSQVRRADRTIRRQQTQLIEKETLAAIGEMSSAVAHGLRNPLASIRSSAEVVQVGELEIAREAAGDIIDQSDRLERWVNELLSYTRPHDAGVTAIEITPLLDACMCEFSCELERRGIVLSRELDAGLPAVRGNALLIGQALRSVLANAIEAAGSRGRVVVQAIAADARVVLTISDSGPGMTPHELAHAGKPFYTTKPRGLGVGLALARRVVERFGGRLDISSSAGQGTAVRLDMPAL